MNPGIDLESYLNRIQWAGKTQANLTTLSGILNAHMLNIPFENLDILLGRGVHLDLPRLHGKFVAARRGGYCFEHATLLGAALEQMGFKLSRHTARVTAMAPRTEMPRTHMFLLVHLAEGDFIVDPGFGGFGPRAPVPLKEGAEVSVLQEKHWISRDGRYWILNFQNGPKSVQGWVTALDEDFFIDFEVGNHFTSTHPSSHFTKALMLAIRTPRGRVTVMGRDLTVREGEQEQRTQLEDRKALRTLLLEHFKIDLPEVEQIRIPSIPEWT